MRRKAACLLAVLLLGTASFAAEAPDVPTGSKLYLENKSTSDESQLFTELFREKLTKDESKGVYSKPGFPVVDKKEEATYVLRFLFVMRENQKSFGGEAQEHVRVNLWLLDSRGTVIWEHNYDCIRVFREPARECYQHISDDLKAAQVNAEGKRAGWLGWRLAAANRAPASRNALQSHESAEESTTSRETPPPQVVAQGTIGASITVAAKAKDKGNSIPCQRVFVTGNQSYSVQWADEHLFKRTCMAPQADANQATAILDLEPSPGTSGIPNYTPKENTAGYWIGCRRAILGGVTCEDSEGHQTTTTCSSVRGFVGCSTYEGPDPVTTLLRSLLDLLTRNSAYAYLYDAKTHELLWKYQGSWPWDNELMFDSACTKKRRGGTWGTSGGVPNGMSCDEQKLPTDLLQPAAVRSVADPILSPLTNVPAQSAAASNSSQSQGGLVSANLHAESDPSGADIEVDGSFVGNTPSDIQVTEGEHTVSVKKTGFKDWERKLKVSGRSSVRLSAELQKADNP